MRRKNINWTQTMLNLLGTDTDKNIGNRFGIRKDTVRKKRERLGIPRYTRITNEAIAFMGKIPDSEIAKLVDMDTASIGAARRKLGIPACPRGRQWDEEEIALLGKYSDTKIGNMLGISHDMVRWARLRYNRPAYTGHLKN